MSMTMRRKPIPQRITTALDIRGLYGPAVDIACGTCEPHVDLWESGDETPTPTEVEALARLTGFPVNFFYRPVEAHEHGTGWMCGPRKCTPIEFGANRGAKVQQLRGADLAYGEGLF